MRFNLFIAVALVAALPLVSPRAFAAQERTLRLELPAPTARRALPVTSETPVPGSLRGALSPGTLRLGPDTGGGEGEVQPPFDSGRFGYETLAGIAAAFGSDGIGAAAVLLGAGFALGGQSVSVPLILLSVLFFVAVTPVASAFAVWLVGNASPDTDVSFLPPLLAGLATGTASLVIAGIASNSASGSGGAFGLFILVRWGLMPLAEALFMNLYRTAKTPPALAPTVKPGAPVPPPPPPPPGNAYPPPPPPPPDTSGSSAPDDPPQIMPVAADAVPGGRRDPAPLRSDRSTFLVPVFSGHF